MQNKYYYIISSLPYPTFEGLSPVPIEHFISLCREWLKADDARIMKDIDINSRNIHKDDLDMVKKWKHFNAGLKEKIAGARMSKKTRPEERANAGLYGDIFEEPNPLLMEKKYERTRWDFLEQEEFHYFFDINLLAIYLYKLHILERLAVFNKETGIRIFDELCHPAV